MTNPSDEWVDYVNKLLSNNNVKRNLIIKDVNYAETFVKWMYDREVIGKSWDPTSWTHWFSVWVKLTNDTKKDDHIIVVTGNPGMGKTSMMQLIGGTVCLERSRLECFVYTGIDFTNLIDKSEPCDPAYIDEGGRMLLNTEGQNKDQSDTVKTFMQMRFKRNLVVICIPTLWKLNKYVRDERVNEVAWIWHKNEKRFLNSVRIFDLMKHNEEARLVMIREYQVKNKVNMMKVNIPQGLYIDCQYKPVWPLFSEENYNRDKKQKDWVAHVRAVNERQSGSGGVKQEYYNISEICKMLNVSRDTVRKLVDTSVLDAVKVGAVWKIKKEDVDRLTQKSGDIETCRFSGPDKGSQIL